jgi:hypothetical protein
MHYKMDYNLWMVEETFRAENGLGRKQINELGALYWKRAVENRPAQYGFYLLTALAEVRCNLLLTVVLIGGSLALSKHRSIPVNLGMAACAMGGIHVLSILSTAAIIPVEPRHDMMTGVPVVVVILCVGLTALRNERQGSISVVNLCSDTSGPKSR